MTHDSNVIAKTSPMVRFACSLWRACHSGNVVKTQFGPVQYDARVVVEAEPDRRPSRNTLDPTV
jgi:hypothetical protein